MNIREGALTSTSAQENIIRDFLTRFRNTFERALEDRGRMDWNFFTHLVKSFETENLSLHRGIKLTVKFVLQSEVRSNPNEQPDRGSLDMIAVGKRYQIKMNMFYNFDGLEDSSFITGIKWNSFYTTFIHEYKHFLQAVRSGGANFRVNPNVDYYDNPIEQQAWAEGYLEKIKYELQTDDLNSVINYLKKNELRGMDGLQQLKTTNPSAWRAIVKQVVLAAQRDFK